jgi:hypothetical protein
MCCNKSIQEKMQVHIFSDVISAEFCGYDKLYCGVFFRLCLTRCTMHMYVMNPTVAEKEH